MNDSAIYLPGYKINLKAKDILRLKGDGNYTHIYCKGDKTYLVCLTLKRLMATLPEFIRTHKTAAVNPLHVKIYEPDLILKDGTEIPMSKRRRSIVKNLMNDYRTA
ncbi:LytTR family DNA-binding domain-containing protein [Spirosoma sp. SC4-14]|uniref:LytR/AlgR family response regulator transcription factor n=1 Tax=Spirosoma sp. SC4-14 TaxID=3128900 RepID=UPI0030D23797